MIRNKTFLIISLSKQSKIKIYINQKDSLPTRSNYNHRSPSLRRLVTRAAPILKEVRLFINVQLKRKWYLHVFFSCYRSSNSLRLVDVQTCSKFGRKQTHLFRPTISTSTSCLVVSSAVSILCFSESLNLNYENTLFTT